MSGSSLMRNAVKRITHKERHQPAERRKLGLLEKHSDYVERAKDYNKKKKYVKNLQKKAANKNPDEFYFQMNSSEVKNGIHVNKKDNYLDASMVKIMKAQDAGYIATKKSLDDSKIRKLKETLHFATAGVGGKRTIFCEEGEDVSDKIKESKEEVEVDVSVLKKYKEVLERTKRSKFLKNTYTKLHLERQAAGASMKRPRQNEDGKIIPKWKKQRSR